MWSFGACGTGGARHATSRVPVLLVAKLVSPVLVSTTSGQSARYHSDSIRSRHLRVSHLTGPSLNDVVS